MPRTRRTNSTIPHPDLSKVETRVKVADGDYHVQVADVTLEQGQEYEYLKWKFRIEGPECVGGLIYYNTSFSPNSLWNLKELLIALGQEIPAGPGEIDPAELKGLDLDVTVENETYEGKQYPRVVEFSEHVDEGSKRTTTKASAPKTNGKTPAAEPDPVSADDINDMDQDELEDVVGELNLDVDVASFKTLRKMRAAVIDAAEKEGVLAG
jgi:hypothetical protein